MTKQNNLLTTFILYSHKDSAPLRFWKNNENQVNQISTYNQ